MSASIYKIVHFLGIILIFLSLGGVIMHGINRGSRDHNWKKQVGISHGIGLFLILLGGFGMQAKLHYAFSEGWLLTKVFIWFAFGGLFAFALRKPELGRLLWILTAILGAAAAFMAIIKPY